MQRSNEWPLSPALRWDGIEPGVESAYHRCRFQRAVKRFLDIILAALLLAVFAPVLLVLVLWIRLDSPGPAFFNRERVGRGGKPFVMHKLRSMYQDAEQRLPSLQHLNLAGPHAIKIPDDPRVTRIGRVLRTTSLDELPQLWNVLRGEMSLVGPRPQALSEVALYTQRERRRLEAIPGMTGLWQVKARHDPSFATWVRWDLAYLDDWSLPLDGRILWQTALMLWRDSRALLTRSGSERAIQAVLAPENAPADVSAAAAARN